MNQSNADFLRPMTAGYIINLLHRQEKLLQKMKQQEHSVAGTEVEISSLKMYNIQLKKRLAELNDLTKRINIIPNRLSHSV